MRLVTLLFPMILLPLGGAASAASPGNAPPLPMAGARTINVSTEAQLQTAMANLRNGDTILLADGIYSLTSSLYINGRNNITIRGAAGSTNVDRAVAYGLDNTTPYFDHAGGVIRNNFVCLLPGLMSAGRKAGSDGSLIAWNSPGTQIDHNSVLLNGNEFYAVEFRFPTTTNGTARNTLADAPIHLRDSASATLSSNLLTAVPGMFVNPGTGDLHLLASATNAIDKGLTLSAVTNDFDGDRRPRGARSDIGADDFMTNAPPRTTDFKLFGTDVVISFTTFLGESYDVLRATDAAGGPWSLVADNIPGSGGVVQTTNTNGAGQVRQFYRVRLSP